MDTRLSSIIFITAAAQPEQTTKNRKGMQKSFTEQNFHKDKSLCNKMHEITFMKCFNSFFFYICTIKKKCDMFLIAAVTKDNDLGGSTWNISHVIHAVVGGKCNNRENTCRNDLCELLLT